MVTDDGETQPSTSLVERIDRHRDGSVRARGHERDGVLHGYWEWFRVDGSRLRSGHFDRGAQVGEWITYTADGQAHTTKHFGDAVAD